MLPQPVYTRAGVTTLAVVSTLTGVLIGIFVGGGSLKEWQTFMAALVALAAASLAYRGAMAKVALDREVIARDARRRLLSLALRLELGIGELIDRVEKRLWPFAIANYERPHKVKPHELSINTPAELDEAWGQLDMFPRRLATLIAAVRRDLRELADLSGRAPSGDVVEWSGLLPPDRLRPYERLLNEISRNAAEARGMLRAEIDLVQ